MHYIIYAVSVLLLIASLYALKQKKQEWILLLVMVTYVNTALMYLFEATTVLTLITIGSTQIHLNDMIMLVLLCYVIWSLVNKPRVNGYTGVTLFLVAFILISLVRGVAAGVIGTSSFFADVRKYAYFVASVGSLYLHARSSSDETSLARYKRLIDILMNVTLIYVFVIWGLDLLFGMNDLPGQIGGTMSDGGSTFRIIQPDQVLMIAVYTLWSLYRDMDTKRHVTPRTILFVVVVLFMQWRTVVAAFLVGLLLILIWNVIKYRSVTQKFALECIIAVGTVGVFLLLFGQASRLVGMIENMFGSFGNVGSDTGTFATRVEAWQMILESLEGVNAWLGLPFGQGTSVSWQASAHNGYVDWITKMGYLGAVALLAFMITLLVTAIRRKQALLCVIIVTVMVYWIGYGFSIEQGALLGFILGYLEKNTKEQREAESCETDLPLQSTT